MSLWNVIFGRWLAKKVPFIIIVKRKINIFFIRQFFSHYFVCKTCSNEFPFCNPVTEIEIKAVTLT